MAKRPTSRISTTAEERLSALGAGSAAPIVGFVGPVAPVTDPASGQAPATTAPLPIEKAASDEIEARVEGGTLAISAPVAPALDAKIVATARATLIGTMDDWASAAIAEIQRVVLLLEETRDWTDEELAVCRRALVRIAEAASHFTAELTLRSRVAWLGRVSSALDGIGLTEADVLDFNYDTRRLVTIDGRKIEIA